MGWEGGGREKGKRGKSQEQKEESADSATAAAPSAPWAAVAGHWDSSRTQRGLQPSVWAPRTDGHIVLSEARVSNLAGWVSNLPSCGARLPSRIRPSPEKFWPRAALPICSGGTESRGRDPRLALSIPSMPSTQLLRQPRTAINLERTKQILGEWNKFLLRVNQRNHV